MLPSTIGKSFSSSNPVRPTTVTTRSVSTSSACSGRAAGSGAEGEAAWLPASASRPSSPSPPSSSPDRSSGRRSSRGHSVRGGGPCECCTLPLGELAAERPESAAARGLHSPSSSSSSAERQLKPVRLMGGEGAETGLNVKPMPPKPPAANSSGAGAGSGTGALEPERDVVARTASSSTNSKLRASKKAAGKGGQRKGGLGVHFPRLIVAPHKLGVGVQPPFLALLAVGGG